MEIIKSVRRGWQVCRAVAHGGGRRSYATLYTFHKGSLYFSWLLPEPGPVAKSNIILDVKPWDDETGGCGMWVGPGDQGLKYVQLFGSTYG